MDETEFWQLVDSTRETAEGDPEEQADLLVERLVQLDPESVLDFARHFESRYNRAYRWDLWGAAWVLLDGASIRSCITFAVQADGAEISTVEGLARDGEMHPLQDEFSDKQGLQCGYCTPGMLMRACEILAQNPDPTPEQVRAAIASNLCRCTGYQFIAEAVLAAAARMRETKEVAS